MSTENTENLESTTQAVDTDKTSEVTLTIEQALEQLASEKAQTAAEKAKLIEAITERDKSKQKLRKLEESAGSVAELQAKYDALIAEKSTLAEQFEAINNEYSSVKESIKQQTVNSTLTTALEAVGAKSVSTVMKLIDKSKLQFDDKGQINADSVVAAIEEVRNSDPVLFGEPTDPKDAATTTGNQSLNPGVRRAGEAATEGAFEKEIKSAKTQRDIENVMRKYGKM